MFEAYLRSIGCTEEEIEVLKESEHYRWFHDSLGGSSLDATARSICSTYWHRAGVFPAELARELLTLRETEGGAK